MKRLPRIEQYGLIGGIQASGPACDDGTIDWLCFPHFDSPALFPVLFGSGAPAAVAAVLLAAGV